MGPHDPSDRFTYWVRRFAEGGHALAPDRPAMSVQVIDGLVDALRHFATSTDAAAITAATEALAKGTEAFAARRMNQSIRQALAGRSVEAL